MSLARVARLTALVLALLALASGATSAQDVDRVATALLEEVMPGADRFDAAAGDPPVKRAYRGDELIGYVFVTSDLPPEVVGYDGPIRTLVGMTPEGVLTGVRPLEYRESRRYEWGDFLNDPWLLAQFVGKSVSDRFAVNRDIDGIAQVTISVRALARSVRDAARRVAVAYAGRAEEERVALSEGELALLSWFEIRELGAAATIALRQERREPLDVSVIHLGGEELGRHLLGLRYESLARAVAEGGGADRVILYVVEGLGFAPPLRDGWSVVQGGDTLPIPRERVTTLGSAGGALAGETSQVGVLLLDERVDLSEPVTFVFDRGRPDLGAASAEYTSELAHARIAEERAARVAATATPDPTSTPPTPAPTAGPADAAPDAAPLPAEAAPSPAVAERAPVATAPPSASAPALQLDFADEPEPGAWEELLATTSWLRVAWMLLALGLALAAFLTKKAALRWVSLAVTLVVLGWLDGGFLSISHVTGVIRVGFAAIVRDLPLLLMVTFTLVTLLVWGRVFCGYLCPFGALQDFIDRLVPARFKRDLPGPAHRVALKAKYVVLAIVLLPALAGMPISLYQYVEPFGTVFFLSGSLTLWAIAVPILVAAAIVPRFYCRYLCPLGAALAVGSLVSLRRIPRVEQCDYCKVCEQRCPTGAIEGPRVDFAECVRCSDCEVMLRDRRGVCGHDMEEFRPRLVQIRGRVGLGVGR